MKSSVPPSINRNSGDPVPGNEFLFGSFLPYRKALNLERWVGSLIELDRSLTRGGPICETKTNSAEFNAKSLLGDFRPPWQSEADFESEKRHSERLAKMTGDELDEFMEEEGSKISKMIDSGELDLWDDSVVWRDRQDVASFVRESLSHLSAKVSPACNPKVSFLEKVVRLSVEELKEGTATNERLRALYALLVIWDYGKMHFEGEPPYSVKFSPQVAEALGIDPEMESIKMSTMPPLDKRGARRIGACLKLVKRGAPEMLVEALALGKVAASGTSSDLQE